MWVREQMYLCVFGLSPSEAPRRRCDIALRHPVMGQSRIELGELHERRRIIGACGGHLLVSMPPSFVRILRHRETARISTLIALK